MTKSIAENILQTLDAIRSDSKFDGFKTFCYAFPTHLETEAILFLGINPSESENQPLYFKYKLEQRGNENPYFKKMEDISIFCKNPWTHLDLFHFRKTNQEEIYQILESENGVAYLWEQLQLTGKLIKEAFPKVIVVSNALAGIFLGKEQDKQRNINVWLGYDFVFDDKLGTYRWNNIPVFFSGMLSGQRALDKGSYERLRWHIKKCLLEM